jgi:peptide/nickel transport system substrate-binding protein
MRWTRCCATNGRNVKLHKVFFYLLVVVALGGCGDSTPPPATPAALILNTPTPAPAPAQPSGTLTRAIGENPDSFNPILSTSSAGAAVNSLIFPVLVGRNPFTGQDSSDNALAERWEVAGDGLTYTFYLRPNVFWSDGDPVDAADFKFTYDAIGSEQVESPHKAVLENIAGIAVLDPLTVQVTFKQPRCDALAALRVGWLPSHLYETDFKDIMENLLNSNPAVSAGPFVFQSWAPGENVTMRRNQRYWQGTPSIERLVFQIVAAPADRLAGLLAGQLDVRSTQIN